MKNLIKIVSVLLLLFISNYTQAQNTCEIDSTSNRFSTGEKIIVTSDGSLLIGTIERVTFYDWFPDTASYFITKLDICGNIIWKTRIDSLVSKKANFNCFKEQPDGSFLIAISSGQSPYRRIKIYKITSFGSIISTININNGIEVFSMIEINSNAYLFFGDFYKNPFNDNRVLLYDSLGNIKNNQLIIVDSTNNNSIRNVFRTDKDEIYLFMLAGRYNFTVKIDTLGNILNIKKDTTRTYIQGYQNFLSYDSSFIYRTTVGDRSDTTLILKYSLDGKLIKSTSIKRLDPNYTNFLEIGLKNNGLLFLSQNNLSAINKIITILDSNLNIQRFDTLYSNSGDQSYYRIYEQIAITKDSSLVGVGFNGQDLSSSGIHNYFTSLRKQPLYYNIKTIKIVGASTINQKNASIKLTLNILPANAYNKQVLWSINDTSLATITQTGLVTAKANGTVIVTATAADGGGATANKTITITNQTVGINEVNLTNQITVYPNPASNVLTIKTINNIAPDLVGLQLQLLDITGKIIAQFINQTEIDLSAIANGMYLLHIQTPNGNLVKQVVVNK